MRVRRLLERRPHRHLCEISLTTKMANPPNKVQHSKNRKKGWRKHSNIEEVEEFLEDQRQEQRLGGPFNEKTNETLFFVDVDAKISARSKAKRKLHEKPLRCFQILTPSSRVPPPIKPYQLQTIKNKVKNIKRKKKAALKTPAARSKNSVSKKPFDIWDEKLYIKSDLDILANKIRSNESSNVPKHHYRKTSLLPPVETPHPGASYNPSFIDHQALLAVAHEVEVQKEREELHLKRVLTDKFPTTAPTEESWIKEMSHGLFESDEESIAEELDANNDEALKSWGKPINRENKKLRSKRNAEKLAKDKAQEKKKEKYLKKFKHEMNCVKQFKKEIMVKQKITTQRIKKREEEKVAAMYKPGRISREKYEAPDIELHLSDELPGSLRKTKVQGNILEDRYKSLQRRNIIEPRQKKKRVIKYKPKTQVKRSHRAEQAEIDQLLRFRNKRKCN